MYASEAETVLALRVLLNSSNEILHAHRDLALQTLEQVRSVLAVKPHNNTTSSNIQAEQLPFRNHETPEDHSPCQLEDRSHAIADPTEPSRTAESERNHEAEPETLDGLRSHGKSTLAQVNVRNRKRELATETRLAKLLQAIEKHLPKFVEFSQKTASLFDLLDNVQGRGGFNMRLDHIKRIDGNKTPNEKERLLKGLCQISLAREFTAWERKRGWSTRVDQLYSQISKSSPGGQRSKKRLGKVSQYLRDAGCRDTDRSVANKALCQGTIQLLFKDLIEEALGDSSLEQVAGGLFSAVAIFEFHQFQLLTVQQLPQLIDFLIPEDAHLGSGDCAYSHRSLRPSLHSIKRAAVWSERLQSDFESYCRTNCLNMRDTIYQSSEAQTEENGPPKANITRVEQVLPSNGLGHYIGTSTGGGSQMLFSGNLDLHQDQRIRHFDASHNPPATSPATWSIGEVTANSSSILPHVQSQTITHDVNRGVDPEPGIMHPRLFSQFMIPSSADTVIPSISPQIYLPRSMDIEPDILYSDFLPGTVDSLILSNFPQITPYATTHSPTEQNYGNANVRTDTTFSNYPTQVQRFDPYA
ncbi:uncharacterized protein N7518_004195 [Penicillium psychrosexuale]|uniref:uncharacterized protein n=1 Tax=Penicillium psychrosexuale TaxID=1002107 RepID=UPI0025451BB6|nr:uncharacterized protein N7518_004195 [Penicillium psychrosexuale]KAJ5795655.1 hypothetical protein N7518_004195 [Penicillium psychrosexuale]